MATIDPLYVNVNEYVDFTQTYSVTFDPSTSGHQINQVTVTSSSGDFSSYITINMLTTSQFSISGKLSDVFDREMHYIMPGYSHHIVTRWQDIPNEFETVYKYKGAQQSSIVLDVNVDTTEGNVFSQIEVSNNYAAANANLVDYITRGVY